MPFAFTEPKTPMEAWSNFMIIPGSMVRVIPSATIISLSTTYGLLSKVQVVFSVISSVICVKLSGGNGVS